MYESDKFMNYLPDGKQCVEGNGICSDLVTDIRGVPQGRVIGHILFLVYINGLLKIQINGDIISYADITAIVLVLSGLFTIS